MVLKAFKAGESLDIRSYSRQGLGGVVDVIGAGGKVMSAQRRGPGRGSAGREGVGGAGSVVAEGDGAEVADRHHAGGVEVLKDRLVVFEDDVRVLGGVEVGYLHGLLRVLHLHEGNKLRGLPRKQRLDALDELGGRR